MDADTRHQLRQNELAEALGKIRDFTDRRTLGWLAVILLVALGYVGYKYVGWRREVKLTQASQKLVGVLDVADAGAGEAPLTQIRQIIAETSHPGLTALARLQLAEGLEARGEGADGEEKLAEAAAQYETVMRIDGAPYHIKAAAAYRLGLLSETRGDFDKARDMYNSLVRNPGFRGSPFVELGGERLDRFDELAVPVAFEAGVRPLPTAPPVADVIAPSELSEPSDEQPPTPPPVADVIISPEESEAGDEEGNAPQIRIIPRSDVEEPEEPTDDAASSPSAETPTTEDPNSAPAAEEPNEPQQP